MVQQVSSLVLVQVFCGQCEFYTRKKSKSKVELFFLIHNTNASYFHVHQALRQKHRCQYRSSRYDGECSDRIGLRGSRIKNETTEAAAGGGESEQTNQEAIERVDDDVIA